MFSIFNKDPEIYFNRHSMDFRTRFKSVDNVKSVSEKKELPMSEKSSDSGNYISQWEYKRKVAQL